MLFSLFFFFFWQEEENGNRAGEDIEDPGDSDTGWHRGVTEGGTGRVTQGEDTGLYRGCCFVTTTINITQW